MLSERERKGRKSESGEGEKEEWIKQDRREMKQNTEKNKACRYFSDN